MGLWTRKQIGPSEESELEGTYRLVPSLGPLHLTMLGIGAIVGAGLFSITGIAAAHSAGPAIVISFLIAALGCLFAGLCYSELATMIPVAGSAYTYAFATMGEFIAWIIGWDLILEYAVGAATVSISWSAYAVALMHQFGFSLPEQWLASPWQPVHLPDGTLAYGYVNVPAILIVGLLSAVLIIGMQKSAVFNALMVIVKVSVVIVFIAIGMHYINPENYHPFIPPNTGTFGEFGWSGIMRAAGVIFFAYIGFDAVSTAAQETRRPQRDVPIGILGSLAICTILYMLFAWVMTGMVNYRDLGVAAPVALAIAQTPYPWLHVLVNIAILAGFTSVILVMLLGQSRIFYSMAHDGLLPGLFAEVHPRFHTPWRSNLLLMVFVALFGAFAPLWLVGEMTSIGTLLAFVIVCAGVLILRRRHPEYPRPFRTPLVPLVPLLGIATCLAMMVSLGIANWLRLFVWLAIGCLIYFFYGRHYSKV